MLAQSIGAKSGSPLAQHVGTMLYYIHALVGNTHHVGLMLAQRIYVGTTSPQQVRLTEGHFALTHCANVVFSSLVQQTD